MSALSNSIFWLLEHIVVERNFFVLVGIAAIAFTWYAWKRPKSALVIGYNIAVVYLVIELTQVIPLIMPSVLPYLPKPYINILKSNYGKHWLKLYGGPGYMNYDPELTYTLKPGLHHFASTEFSNEISVNSAGVRDDEEDLHQPEIIALGDSHSFGWGVEHTQTFASILEKKLGKKILNTGIPSFGTVRQRWLLDRLDTSNLKYLIIQYEGNDELENKMFLENENTLSISSEETWLNEWKEASNTLGYTPGTLGAYTIRLAVHNLKRSIQHQITPPDLKPAVSPELEAHEFLHALVHAGKLPLENLDIIVWAVKGGTLPQSNAFTDALKKAIQDPSWPPFVRSIKIVDAADRLNNEGGIFYLDSHINVKGHEIIAEEILKAWETPKIK